MNCQDLRFSRHAVQRMFERGVSVDDVRQIVQFGEMIESYPDDEPWPSRLLLLVLQERVFHAVVAEADDGVCYIITVYEPDPERWEPGFRLRKT